MADIPALNDKRFWDGDPISEGRWRDLAYEVRASERQMFFAICRFRGMSQSRSAVVAGYADGKNPARMRGRGHAAGVSKAVRELLEKAALENPGACRIKDSPVTELVRQLERELIQQQKTDNQIIGALIRAFTNPPTAVKDSAGRLKKLLKQVVYEESHAQS